MTRFDDSDLDRLFRVLATDLPEDGFEARLHAALVAESIPAASGRWRAWGRRFGTGVAIAAIPLAAAAAVGSQWRSVEKQAETPTSQVELASTAPARTGAALQKRESPTPSVPTVDPPANEPAAAPDPIANRVATQSRVASSPLPMQTPIDVGAPLEDDTSPAPVLDAPHIERVRLVSPAGDSAHAASAPAPARVATPSATPTPAQTATRTSEATQRTRERVQERRQRETLPARERRQAGPRPAR